MTVKNSWSTKEISIIFLFENCYFQRKVLRMPLELRQMESELFQKKALCRPHEISSLSLAFSNVFSKYFAFNLFCDLCAWKYVNIWSLEDNLEELIPSFHHMDSRDGTRVFRIDNQVSLPSKPSLWPSNIVFKDFFIFICLYHRFLDLGPKFKSHHLWGVYRMYSNDRTQN